MARRKSTSEPPPEDFEEQISDIDVGDEMSKSFLEYAYSVIYTRALPDARDGLKPVQRRILFTMSEMNLRPDRGHVKAARVVGEVMGKLHPHSDTAIYDALVRLAQSWVLRVPTIDGHGNFGSPDDGPAQMRYCLTGDMRVRLADGSSVRLDGIADLAPDSEADIDLEVFDRDGKPVRATKAFNSGLHPTKRLTTKSGHSLRGTYNHPVLCLVPVAGVPLFQWLRLDEITPGTVICLARNAWTTAIPTAEERQLGTELVGAKASEKVVPNVIWNGTVGLKRAFLQALFEGDGGMEHFYEDSLSVQYSTYSKHLAADLQELLLEFGVHSNLTHYSNSEEQRVMITGRHNVRAFAEQVGFLTAKQRELQEWLATSRSTNPAMTKDFVPYVADYVRSSISSERGQGRKWLTKHNFDRVERWQADRTHLISRIKNDEVLRTILPIMDSGYRFVEVAGIDDCEPAEVYSIRVDSEDHSFLAGGFVNHNTECRMAPPAIAMTNSLDEDVVDFKLNYDGREEEPVVLPAAFPNLLVNGSTGIAVGMATNMAPHNLVEVVQALRHLIKHPNATIDDLMRFIPGPDLPTGGKIVGLDGIRDAYETGRGAFKMRATARVENVTPRRKGIVVTELPYNVGPERVIERIKTLVQGKKLQGIADLKDLTDREHGMQLVIEIKNGFHPEALLEQLYKMTPLEESFNINNVALVEGQPRTLGLKDLLTIYLDHRFEVTRRRTQFRLNKAEERLHLVDGLLIAILDIDEVIAIIRSSDDASAAKDRLMTVFDLSDAQAQYILDMQLRRLTKFSKLELDKEKSELEQTIRELQAILENDNLLRSLVSGELNQVAKDFGTPRKTILLESAGQVAASAVPLEVADDPCWVLLSSTGLLARTTNADQLGTEGARAKHDAVVSAVRATARGQVGLVTSKGRLIRLGVLDMPALPPTANAPNLQGGAPIAEFVSLGGDERVLCLTTMEPDSIGLALGTTSGVVKRVRPEHLTNRDDWEVIALDAGDEVVGAVELRTGDEELVFVSSDAQLLHFGASLVRPQGRSGGGIAGIKLAPKQAAVFFGALDSGRDNVVVTIAGSESALPGTDNGAGKVAPFTEYPAKGRATGGVRAHRFLKGEDKLLLAWVGPAPAHASAASGSPVELPEANGKRDGSGLPLSQPVAAVAGPLD